MISYLFGLPSSTPSQAVYRRVSIETTWLLS